MLKGASKARKFMLERRLILYVIGVASSTPNPNVSALNPIAIEWNGLTSTGIVGARWVGIGRTYSLVLDGSPGEGAGAIARSLFAGSAGLSWGEAAVDFANPGVEERFRGDELSNPVSRFGVSPAGRVATLHVGTFPRSGPVYGTYLP